MARECALDLAADGVVYAEVRFAPEQHLERGLQLPEVVEAVLAGFEAGSAEARAAGTPIRVGTLLTAMRHAARSTEIAELAVRYRDVGVVGFDIAGAEAGYPPTRHLDAFEYLQRENFHFTIHAGEAFGLPSIWQAIQWCGADRLGHGVRIVDDIDAAGPDGPRLGRLSAYVRDKRIPLELCPSSNVQTGAAASIARAPDRAAARPAVPGHRQHRQPADERHLDVAGDGAAGRGVRLRLVRPAVVHDQRDEELVHPVRRAAGADQRGDQAGVRQAHRGRVAAVAMHGRLPIASPIASAMSPTADPSGVGLATRRRRRGVTRVSHANGRVAGWTFSLPRGVMESGEAGPDSPMGAASDWCPGGTLASVGRTGSKGGEVSKQPSAPGAVSSRFARPIGWVRDLPIWTKLGLIMIVPTIATIVVGTAGLLEQVEQASGAERARSLTVLSGDAGALVHQLQDERARAIQLLDCTRRPPLEPRQDRRTPTQQAKTDAAKARVPAEPHHDRRRAGQPARAARRDRGPARASCRPCRARSTELNKVPLSIAETSLPGAHRRPAARSATSPPS